MLSGPASQDTIRTGLAQAVEFALFQHRARHHTKQDPAFLTISHRYTSDIGNIRNAVEQQESGTAR